MSRLGTAASGARALPGLPGHAFQARAAAWLRMATVTPEIDSGEFQVVARVLNGATVAEALLHYLTVVTGIPVTREGSTYRRGRWTQDSPVCCAICSSLRAVVYCSDHQVAHAPNTRAVVCSA